MKRIMEPLSMMGAKIRSIHCNDCAPLAITGCRIHGIHYQSPVASAQVQIRRIAGPAFTPKEKPVITESYISRNHSELMLSAFGADIRTENTTAVLRPGNALKGLCITVPGDISSAAFFIAAAHDCSEFRGSDPQRGHQSDPGRYSSCVQADGIGNISILNRQK